MIGFAAPSSSEEQSKRSRSHDGGDRKQEVQEQERLRRLIERLLCPSAQPIPTGTTFSTRSSHSDHFLPRPQLVCLAPWRISCDRMDPRVKDWNEGFQQLWELEVRPVFDIEHRTDLRRFLKAFDSHASEVVRRLMTSDAPPRGLRPVRQFPHCYRLGNLFIRKWTDPTLGRNVQRAFSALMQAKVPGLHFPLTSCFSFFGTVVTVQAFVPVSKDSRRLYRADGVADEKFCRHAHQLVLKLLNALNLEPHIITSGPQQQAKQLGLELYEGTDARCYVTNALGLLPLLRPGESHSGPQLRLMMLQGSRAPVAFLRPLIDAVRVNIRRSARHFVATVEEFRVGAPRRLPDGLVTEVMHACGLNVSLLFLFALEVQTAAVEAEASDTALNLVCLDLLARTFRDQIFIAAAGRLSQETAAASVGTANMLLARAVGSMLHESTFESNILPAVLSKFRISKNDVTENGSPDTGVEAENDWRRMSAVASAELTYRQVVAALRATIVNDQPKLTNRICALCGLVLSRGVVEEISVISSNHNFSSFLNTEQDMRVSAFVQECTPNNVSGEFYTAYVLPRRAETFCRLGNTSEAMTAVRQTASVCMRSGRHYLYYDALLDCAMVAVAVADFEAAEPLLFRACEAFSKCEQEHAQPQVPLGLSVRRQHIVARMLFAHLKCRQGLHREAKNAFLVALDLCHKLPSECRRATSPLCLAAYGGLLEVSGRSPVTVVDLAGLHSDISHLVSDMYPTKFVYSIISRFGLQLLEAGYPMLATTSLTTARTVCERVYGSESAEMTHLLTSLAFAYYRWNVDKYGDEALKMLEEAKSMTEDIVGRQSVAHLVAINNLVTVAIARKHFTKASRLLNSVLSRRKQFKDIPANHPAFDSLLWARELLRKSFLSEATVLIQTAWGRYTERKRVKGFLQMAAALVQRVGRGFVSRKLSGRYGECEEHPFRQREQNPLVTNFSRPLLLAAARYSAAEPEWTVEYQLCIEEGFLSSAGDERRAAIAADFHDAARKCVAAVERSPMTGRLEGCGPGVYQFGNILVTRWAWDELTVQAHVQNTAMLLEARLPFLKLPLTVLLEGQDRSLYLAQALFPIPRDRCTLYEEDGTTPTCTNPIVDSILNEWLASINMRLPTIGVHIVRGADGFWYVTNAICLGNFLLVSSGSLNTEASYNFARSVRALPSSPQEVRDLGASSTSSSWYAQLGAKFASGDISGATAMAEARVLARTSAPHEYVFGLEVLAAVYTASNKHPLASSTLRQACRICESNPEMYGPHTIRVLEALGNSLSRQTLFPAAHECFSKAVGLRESLPLHPRHGVPILARSIVGLVRCAQRGATAWPSHPTEIDAVLRLGRPCQPLLSLATTLAHHESSIGNAAASLGYLDHALRIATVLYGSTSLNVVSVLEQQSKVLFARRSKPSLLQSRLCLEQAARILRTIDAKSSRMSLLLNNLGCTCLALHDYLGAQGHFLAAKELVESRPFANDHSVELVHLQKNVKVVEMRIQLRCVMRVQAAVRAWKARRHALDQLKLDDPERYRLAILERAHKRHEALLRLEMLGRLKVAHSRDAEVRAIEKQRFIATLRLLDKTRHGATFAAARGLLLEKDAVTVQLLIAFTAVAAEPASRAAIWLHELASRAEAVSQFTLKWHSASKFNLLVRHVEFLDRVKATQLVDEEAAARQELSRTKCHTFQLKALTVFEALGRRHVMHLCGREHYALSELHAAGWNLKALQRRREERHMSSPKHQIVAPEWSILVEHATAEGAAATEATVEKSEDSVGAAGTEGAPVTEAAAEAEGAPATEAAAEAEASAASKSPTDFTAAVEVAADATGPPGAESAGENTACVGVDPPAVAATAAEDDALQALGVQDQEEAIPSPLENIACRPTDADTNELEGAQGECSRMNEEERDSRDEPESWPLPPDCGAEPVVLRSASTGSTEEEGDAPGEQEEELHSPEQVEQATAAVVVIEPLPPAGPREPAAPADRRSVELIELMIAAERDVCITIPREEGEGWRAITEAAHLAQLSMEQQRRAALQKCIEEATRMIQVDIPLAEASERAEIRDSFHQCYSSLLRDLLLVSPSQKQPVDSTPHTPQAERTEKLSVASPGTERRPIARRVKLDVFAAREAEERTAIAKLEAAAFSSVLRLVRSQAQKLHRHAAGHPLKRPSQPVKTSSGGPRRVVVKKQYEKASVPIISPTAVYSGPSDDVYLSICQRTGRPLLGGFPVDAHAAAVMRVDRQLRNFKSHLLRMTDGLLSEEALLAREVEGE